MKPGQIVLNYVSNLPFKFYITCQTRDELTLVAKCDAADSVFDDNIVYYYAWIPMDSLNPKMKIEKS